MAGVSSQRLRRPLIPFIVLAVSLLLTAASALYVAAVTQQQDRARFDAAIERTQTAISRRIETYVNLLRSGAGFFATSERITHQQFRAYVDRLRLGEQYPGIQGMGVSARVLPVQMEGIVQRMKDEGYPDFKIKPDFARDEYHLILYLEPLDKRNAAAIGFDMFTEATRRAAMERARDTGEPATSGRVTLVQEIDANKQAGFLIYMPIYYLGGVPQTVELRRLLLAGFVYAPFRADDFLGGIFGSERFPSGVSYAVYDGDTVSPQTRLHDSDPAATNQRQARFVKASTLAVPGQRNWTIVHRSGPAFEAGLSQKLAAGVLAAGIVVSLILFGLSFSQARAQRRAERSADDLRASEKALRASEGKFRRLADANLIGVVFSDIDGAVTGGNDEYFRIIGRRRESVLAEKLRWDQITPPEWMERDNRAVEQLRATGICAPFEKEYIRPDGSRIPVLVGVAMLEDSTTQTVAMIVDLTERKQAERAMLAAKDAADAARAEAEEASRLKDEFLATVSHELRTPLNAVFGWAQLLRGGRRDPEDVEHGLETIEKAARAQSQLIDDLLDVSRIVAGNLRLEVQPVRLAPVIEAAIASITPAADAKGISLATALDDVGPVNGDPHRIQQIVWNLLTNAVKFTQRGGNVCVALQRHQSSALVTVTDSGIGVAAEFLPHLFERFRQADPASTRRYGGLGLGLAIVRHLVELHGGTVEARSEGEGRGATFTVTLPLAALHTVPARGASSVESHALDGVRVLLAEDDPVSRELVVEMLQPRGATVAAAASASEALAMLESFDPHVVISDIGMPNEDGYMLLSRIRALPPDRGGRVPVIALTALARPEDRRRALDAGFAIHLAKPIDANDLAAAVSNLAGAESAR